MTRKRPTLRSVLFIHEVNYKTKPIFEMHEFPEILSSKGIRVSFLHFEEGARFWKGWTRKPSEEIPGRAVVESKIRLLTPFQFGIPGLDRLLLPFLLPIALIQELKENRPSVVVSYVFPSGGLFVIFLCKLFSVPHLQRVIDYTPGLRPFPFSMFLWLVEKLIFWFGENFSTHNAFLRERILQNGKTSNKIFLNFPPISGPQKQDSLPNFDLGAFERHAKKSKLNLVFVGTMYRFANLVQISELLICSQRFREGELHFHIFGSGQDEHRLVNLLASHPNQTRVTYYGFLDFSRIYDVLRHCDLGLVPFDPIRVGHYALPNKALQYLAAGLPVVSTHLEGLRRTLSSGCLVTYQDYESLENTLIDFLSNKNQLARLKNLAAKESQRFTYENSSEAFLMTLEEVASNG